MFGGKYMISSVNNERIKKVAKLVSSAKLRKETGLMVLEGERLCLEAEKIEELYYTEKAYNEALVSRACFYEEVTPEVFKKLSDTINPQGVIAVVARPKLDTTLKVDGKYLAFENIQDPGNLGTVARTAEALGIDGLIVKGVDPFSPKVLRASMGAILRLPIIEQTDLLEYIASSGKRIVGTVVTNAKSIKDFEFGADIVLIGNEANGLTEQAKAICNELVTIKMAGRAESLNAAAASSIIAWEMVK